MESFRNFLILLSNGGIVETVFQVQWEAEQKKKKTKLQEVSSYPDNWCIMTIKLQQITLSHWESVLYIVGFLH